jgi:hypothetical protein
MAVIRTWVIGTSSESPPAIASVCTWGGPSGASSAESDGAMPAVAGPPDPERSRVTSTTTATSATTSPAISLSRRGSRRRRVVRRLRRWRWRVAITLPG